MASMSRALCLLMCLFWPLSATDQSADFSLPSLTDESVSVVVIAPSLLLRRFIHSGDERLLSWSLPKAVSQMRLTARAHRNVSIHSKSCPEKNVSVHFKYGSYPVLNPGQFKMPKSLLNASERAIVHSMHLQTSQQNQTLSVASPRSGIWYAAAFVDWMDPRQIPIQQSGLMTVCYTFLYAEVAVEVEKPTPVQEKALFHVHLQANHSKYLQYQSTEQSPATLIFTLNCKDCKKIAVYVQLNVLPTTENNSLQCALVVGQGNGTQKLSFSTQPNSIYYIEMSVVEESSPSLGECPHEKDNETEEADLANIPFKMITLVKEVSTDRFEYEMNLPKGNKSWNELVPLSNDTAVLAWSLHGNVDIGGSLTVAVSIKADLKYFTGYRRKMLDNGKAYRFEPEERLYRTVVCLREAEIGRPLSNGTCQYSSDSSPALMVLSNIDSTTISEYVHIPYPEEGDWFLSMRAFEAELTEDGDNIWYKVLLNESISYNKSAANVSVITSISSAPCLASSCGRFGDCEYFESGGIIFSGCVCRLNYGGWDCSDDRSALSSGEVLLGTLLLTLSNILFLLPAYVAFRRTYYSEACVYTLTCAASTAYHACDAPDRAFAACLLDAAALQFADFFSGLLALWMTLVLVAALSGRFTAALRLAGTIFIALITAWNKHSLVAFMLPLCMGLALLLSSWALKMHSSRRLFPSRSFYLRQLPLAVAVASVGLTCYAFLQTKENYKIVHSFWHMIIALSIVCILPNPKTFYPQIEIS